MRPILFTIFGFSLSSYFSFVFIALICAATLFIYLSKKYKFNLINAVDILLIIMSTWFIGARLFHVIFELPSYYLKNPIEIFYISKGGFVLYGGIIFVSFCIYIYTKIKNLSFFKVMDISAAPLMLGMAIGRIGCFMQGCCYGKTTTLPWGMVFKTVSLGHLHPTQLYMSFYNFLIFLVSLKLLKKNKFVGYTGLISLALYSLFRFFVEYFRADYRGAYSYLSISQLISILVFFICVLTNFKKLKTNH